MPEVHTQVGLTTELDPSFTPLDATNRTLTWTTTNPEVITVNSAGIVTAVSVDTAYVVVITADGGHTDSSLFRVFPFFADACNAFTSGGNFFGGGTVPTAWNPFNFNPNDVRTIGHQEWTGHVGGCAHVRGTSANFVGVTLSQGGTFNADCRINFGDEIAGLAAGGDLFSWCAVARFGHLMCPYPWRVPTAEDFATLDRYMRGYGDGQDTYFSENVVNRYFDLWGGRFTGMITTGTSAANTPVAIQASIRERGTSGMYWSQTENSSTGAHFFYFGASGRIHPQDVGAKSAGRAVRCVRDI